MAKISIHLSGYYLSVYYRTEYVTVFPVVHK